MTNHEEYQPPVVPGSQQNLPAIPGPPQIYNYPQQPYTQYPPPPQIIYTQQTVIPTSTWATLSLVFGILGLITGCCTFGVFSIGAVVTGHAALNETKTGERGGHGMAIAGLVMGYLLVIPAIVFSIMGVAGTLFQ